MNGLAKEWPIVVAQNVIINVHGSSLAIVDDIDSGDSVAIGACEQDALNEFGVIGEVAEEDAEVLHDLIWVV